MRKNIVLTMIIGLLRGLFCHSADNVIAKSRTEKPKRRESKSYWQLVSVFSGNKITAGDFDINRVAEYTVRD
jgi:hypothetical protein